MEKRRHRDRRSSRLVSCTVSCTATHAARATAVGRAGSAEACLATLNNPHAAMAQSAIARIAGRFGHLGAVREALLARSDLSPAVRLHLVEQLSGALAGFVAGRGWLTRDRAERAGREACEKATVAIAADHPDHDIRPLIRHLQANGRLTVELALRALLSGHVAMFECALSGRAGLSLRRGRAIARDGDGLRTVFDKAGLPPSAGAALRDLPTAANRMRRNGKCAGGGLEHSLVERAIINCELSGVGDGDPLMALLRRFAAEAAGENPARNGGRSQAKRNRAANPAMRNHAGRIAAEDAA